MRRLAAWGIVEQGLLGRAPSMILQQLAWQPAGRPRITLAGLGAILAQDPARLRSRQKLLALVERRASALRLTNWGELTAGSSWSAGAAANAGARAGSGDARQFAPVGLSAVWKAASGGWTRAR